MPLPDFLISVNLILCEKALREIDGVSSAIRILDTFYIPDNEIESMARGQVPVATFWAMVFMKVVPGHKSSHELDLVITNTVGDRSVNSHVLEFTSVDDDANEFPGGGTLAVTVNLGIKRLGVCYVSVVIDGEEVSKAPVILRRVKS